MEKNTLFFVDTSDCGHVQNQALERAYPQVQPEQTAKLRIYPMSIEPRAELPSDMKNYYHFGEI